MVDKLIAVLGVKVYYVHCIILCENLTCNIHICIISENGWPNFTTRAMASKWATNQFGSTNLLNQLTGPAEFLIRLKGTKLTYFLNISFSIQTDSHLSPILMNIHFNSDCVEVRYSSF